MTYDLIATVAQRGTAHYRNDSPSSYPVPLCGLNYHAVQRDFDAPTLPYRDFWHTIPALADGHALCRKCRREAAIRRAYVRANTLPDYCPTFHKLDAAPAA